MLGPVEVVGDGGAISLAGKQARLIAALAVAGGRARGTYELVEAIWDGSAPVSARKLVQVYVSQLRKVLPEEIAIETQHGGYAVSLADGALDAARFERLLGEGRGAREAGNPALALSLLERALALWRGRAFGEFAYEEFARTESERLEELRLLAHEERLASGVDLGRHAELLPEVLALAAENPYREGAQALAMLTLYRCGRQTDALDHYRSVVRQLDEELGLEPGERLRELELRILQHDPALDVPASAESERVALPAPPSPLVGRQRELEDLRLLLERRESRLIVLSGAGGSGKTRLALEVARAVEGSYANGVVLVELAPLRDAALVLPTIAQALDVSVDGNVDPLDAVAGAVADRELLLVVDNAEHVREAAPGFAALVARVPRLTMVVTSRAVLHVSGESVFPVAPLADDDAVELFAQRARLLDPSFELTPENEPDVRTICRRVDCLPLAVELAAARTRALTPRALRERLDERLSVLTGGPRDLPARQQTLRETIDWSVGLLDEQARAVFVRLAVFPAGATLDAAERVCGADLDTLGALVDEHLLRRDDVDGEPRFGMLETIREYALELLGEERSAATLAMARYLADVVDEVDVAARGVTPALARLDPELDNIRVALAACGEVGDAELEVRLAGGIWRYCWVRGLGGEGLRRIEAALARDPKHASAARARALHGAGGLAWSVGELARAIALASEAVQVARDVGATWDEMAANTVLGAATNSAGDREQALVYHRRSIELGEQLGLEPVVAKLNIAGIELDLGRNAEARQICDELLEVHRRNENVAGIGFVLLNRGVANHGLGDHEASRSDFEEARACFEEVGMRAHLARVKQGLAAYEASEGRYEAAARMLGEAKRDLDELGVPDNEFGVLMNEWTARRASKALGEEGYEAAYAAGRDSSG